MVAKGSTRSEAEKILISIKTKEAMQRPEVRKKFLANLKPHSRIVSFEEREKLHFERLGKNNPAYKNGNHIKNYDFKFDLKFRNYIRERDNQVCMVCGIHREKLKRALFIHHINYNSFLSVPQNCVTVCNSCHSKTNGNREEWIKFFHSLLNKRYNYQYDNEQNIEIVTEN